MDVRYYFRENPKEVRSDGIFKKFYYKRDIYCDSENAVYTLYLFRLFHIEIKIEVLLYVNIAILKYSNMKYGNIYYLTDLALFHHSRRHLVIMSCLVAGFIMYARSVSSFHTSRNEV